MRSVFSAGLLDAFIQHQFNPFDLTIGVSAGAYNLLCYLSGEPRISLHIFENFASTKNFINPVRFLRGGHLIDLDWIENIAFEERHIDLLSAYSKNKTLTVCLTDVHSGKAKYIQTRAENIKSVIKASAALPVLYRDFPAIENRPMTDGGVADGIPVAEAIRMGAKKIMVIRARHKHYVKTDTVAHQFIRFKMRKYPELLATMLKRVEIFEDSISLIRRPPPGIEIIEVCPPEHFKMGRFVHDRQSLLNGYQTGFKHAETAMHEWLNS